MGAVFLAEYGGESKLATVVRFAAKVLTGLPSILAGVFAYAVIVVTTGSFSALAGGCGDGHLDGADDHAHERVRVARRPRQDEDGGLRHGRHARARPCCAS